MGFYERERKGEEKETNLVALMSYPLRERGERDRGQLKQERGDRVMSVP